MGLVFSTIAPYNINFGGLYAEPRRAPVKANEVRDFTPLLYASLRHHVARHSSVMFPAASALKHFAARCSVQL